jgi:methionine biosynthesis protein MetW
LSTRAISKFGRIYNYLFKSFHFDTEPFDYEMYWGKLEGDISPFKLKLIGSLMETGSSVLDLGCGPGVLLHYLQREKGIRGKGIDISENAVELCRKKNVDADKADIIHSEFQLTGIYDYIVISEVLEHLSNPEQVMLKLSGKYNRYLLITVPNSGFLGERLRLMLGRFPRQWALDPSEHLRFWTVTDFIFWCQELGYRVEDYYGLLDQYYDIKLPLWRWYPRLFSRYVLYKVTVR